MYDGIGIDQWDDDSDMEDACDNDSDGTQGADNVISGAGPAGSALPPVVRDATAVAGDGPPAGTSASNVIRNDAREGSGVAAEPCSAGAGAGPADGRIGALAEATGSGSAAAAAQAASRVSLKWTEAMQAQFLDAVDEVGVINMTGQKIMEKMHVDGLDLTRVRSRVNTYRLKLKREAGLPCCAQLNEENLRKMDLAHQMLQLGAAATSARGIMPPVANALPAGWPRIGGVPMASGVLPLAVAGNLPGMGYALAPPVPPVLAAAPIPVNGSLQGLQRAGLGGAVLACGASAVGAAPGTHADAGGAGGEDDAHDGDDAGDDCAVCGRRDSEGGFWIACDSCNSWFCGRCARMTKARSGKLKEWFCYQCT
ncbi:hypothetical protein PLESTM_001834600 [Pleodorina starrii]|nr:hypothetical protein PLESTM_001834600 [Pleodorina starrii]